MVDLNYIYGFYPPAIANNNTFSKHLLKEYVELLVLEFLLYSPEPREETFTTRSFLCRERRPIMIS